MKMHDNWDKLNLKIKDVETVKMLIALGVKEITLYNLLVNVHNNGFNKGKNVVLDEIREFK